MEEHHLSVTRTARFHTIGDPSSARELWIVLHGYAQLARYFLRPFVGMETDRLIAAPEGLSRFYTDAGHARVGATWMTREDREQEITDQVAYLDRLTEHLLGSCAAGTPVSVLGFSQGAATACRWAMGGRTGFSRIVLWGGTLPPEFTEDEIGARWKGTEMVLVHGERDAIVNEVAHAGNEARLRAAGVPFRSVRFSGGHALDGLTLRQVLHRDH